MNKKIIKTAAILGFIAIAFGAFGAHALKNKVTKMIVMGSVSRLYPELIHTDYVHDKQELAEACRLISIDPNGIDLLHLDLSFIDL